MKTTAIILLITLLPITCFATGKIAAIKKGQRAPFAGILLDKAAEAKITAKRESAVKLCNLEKDLQKRSLTATCNLSKNTILAQLEASKAKHSALMQIKNAELARMNDALKKSQKPDYNKHWFVAGFVGGVALSIGIFYAAAQASK